MSRFTCHLLASILVLLLIRSGTHGAGLRNAPPSLYEQHLFKRQAVNKQTSSSDANVGLYDENDAVISLSANNFKETIFQRPYASLVEFYNSYCGFCRRYAPIWKQLAADILPWQRVVKVAALDCSRDENNPICREFEVMAYPTIRFFSPFYEEGPSNIGVPVMAHEQTEVMAALVENLQNVTEAHTKQLPHGWPKFTALGEGEDAFEGLEPSVRLAFIINENEPNTSGSSSSIGNQVILDFVNWSVITVRRSRNISKPNGVKVIDRDDLKERSLHVEEFTREKLGAAIRTHLQQNHITMNGSSSTKKPDGKKPTEGAVGATTLKSSTDESEEDQAAFYERIKQLGPAVIYRADLEEVVKYALFHEVPNYKHIDGERLTALQRFLAVLVRYFPTNANGLKFLKELRQYVTNVERELSASEYTNRIKQFEQNRTPVFASTRWVGCASQRSGLRRYPCGLWTLFHYLTVQAAESDVSSDPLEILQAMHGYIKHFFGCTDCSAHFQQMAARKKMWNVATKDDAVLWLWSAHNEVNRRLSGDQTEDPDHPKIQFPPEVACPDCRKRLLTNHHNHQQYTLDDGTHEWNLLEVLRFLKQIYATSALNAYGLPSATVRDDSALPAQAAQTAAVSSRSFGSVFSALDVRMAALLYVACIVMLIIAVKMVVKRGYRKKHYTHDLLGKV